MVNLVMALEEKSFKGDWVSAHNLMSINSLVPMGLWITILMSWVWHYGHHHLGYSPPEVIISGWEGEPGEATLTKDSHAQVHTLLNHLFCSKWDYHLQKITPYCIEETMSSLGKWSPFKTRWVCSYWSWERCKIISVLASLLRPWSSAHISSMVNDLDKSSGPTNQSINQPTKNHPTT